MSLALARGAKLGFAMLATLPCLAAMGLLGWSTWADYDSTLGAAADTSRHAARLIEEHAHRYIGAPDQAVMRVIDRMGERQPGDLDRQDWEAIRQIAEELPQVVGLFVLDAQGRLVLTSQKWPAPGENYSDRDYFIASAREDAAGVHIGRLIKTRSAMDQGRFRFTISRPVLQDGRFAGVVVAGIDVGFFQAFYDSLSLGPHATCLVMREDGWVVARQRSLEDDLVTNYGGIPLFTEHLPGAPVGTYRRHGASDGVERMFSYRRIEGLPLVAIAGVGIKAVLAPWRARAFRSGAAGLSLAALLMGVMYILLRSLGREYALAERMGAVLAGTTDGVFEFDRTWRVTYMNQRAADMLPCSRSSVGRSLWDCLPSRAPFEECFGRVLATGEPAEFEAFHNGAWLLLRASRTTDGVAVYFQDVTARKLAEQARTTALVAAERANVAKSKFLAAASHDLRQPFQAMRLYYEVLAPQLNERQRSSGERLDAAMKAGEQLLAALLDVSVLDAGTIKPHLQAVRLAEVLGPVVAECEPQAREAGVHLTLVRSSLLVLTDPVLLTRMTRNLVHNALRYTPSGRVVIGCRRRSGQAHIEVADNGIGITPDKIELIFEDFYQIDNPARERGRGLGLGLSVVKRMSHLLNHPVDVRSKPGHGSIFAIAVPLAPEVAAVSARAEPMAVRQARGA